MRVLFLIDSLVAGGKERQMIELLKGLKTEPDAVCEVAVLSNVVQYEAFSRLGVPAHFLPRTWRHDLSIVPRLRRVMRRFRPDIVHSWNSMCSIYGAPLALACGAKFVEGSIRSAPANVTLRDTDYFRSRLTRPLAHVVVANSAAGLAAYRVPKGRGVAIHNGFDLSRLEGLPSPDEVRRALGISTQHVVGMVASFSQGKDYDSFFEMARIVGARRNDTTFVAIGDGETRAACARATETDPNIRILGRRDDVESIVNIFSVGVLASNASVHGEGISNAIMEYMALGKPVVATDCGGNDELVDEGRTGFLVADKDVPALVERVSRLLDDRALRGELGERGRGRLREEFGLERMTRRYMDLYRGLLGGRE